MSKDISTATFDELMADPAAYGLPTFDQFAKNPNLFIDRDDERFIEVDRGSKNLDRHVQRHIYEIEGYRCGTLEEVERIANAQGIPLRELDYRPQVIPQGGGKCDLLVKFVSGPQRARRKLWG